jgi:predicted transcriptional regulator of viral defense system
MKYNDIKKINKLYFTYQDVAKILSISEDSARVLCTRYVARVLCTRYVKQKYLIRLKRNFYILKERWDNITPNQKLGLANILQVPSYISLMTALSFYEYTTQVQQKFIESISLYRTFTKDIEGFVFNYSKIKNDFYFGFSKKNNIFIASPEKAFIDSLYLSYLGKYNLDLSSLNLEKIDRKSCENILKRYPSKFKIYYERYIK